MGISGRTALFFSDDGGQEWSRAVLDKSIKVQSLSYVENGDIWLAAWFSQESFDPDKGILWRLPNGESNAIGYDLGPRLPAQIQFVTPLRGWLILYNGELLATEDGGDSWRQVRPTLPANPDETAVVGEWREESSAPSHTATGD
jgi:photosystem II stability/assembly factor-like uncharacterized protein